LNDNRYFHALFVEWKIPFSFSTVAMDTSQWVHKAKTLSCL